jgi:hypothetical protein
MILFNMAYDFKGRGRYVESGLRKRDIKNDGCFAPAVRLGLVWEISRNRAP